MQAGLCNHSQIKFDPSCLRMLLISFDSQGKAMPDAIKMNKLDLNHSYKCSAYTQQAHFCLNRFFYFQIQLIANCRYQTYSLKSVSQSFILSVLYNSILHIQLSLVQLPLLSRQQSIFTQRATRDVYSGKSLLPLISPRLGGKSLKTFSRLHKKCQYTHEGTELAQNSLPKNLITAFCLTTQMHLSFSFSFWVMMLSFHPISKFGQLLDKPHFYS